ncbi:putative helicase MOV-10 [Grifola frondosa]|uniref:RNA helicase n=1 Tax=Grifola frondosa TaxID=5627 RepID=A0A1C7MMG5_GRIFR|nr:putative helicase MOV-10 [Grifola frondosa]
MVMICPQLRSTGVCLDQSCTYNHNLKICTLCGVVCINADAFEAHIQGKKHQKALLGRLDHTPLHCSVCHRDILAYQWQAHVAGKSHLLASRNEGIPAADVEPEDVSISPGHTLCTLCQRSVPILYWAAHLASRSHRRKEIFTSYKRAFEEAEKDKHGVTVSHGDATGLDFGIVEAPDAGRGIRGYLLIRTTVPSSRIDLIEIKISSVYSATSPFSATVEGAARTLTYGRDIRVTVGFQRGYVGRYDDRVELVFEDASLGQRFAIVRSVHCIVGSKTDHDLLKPKAAYVPRKREVREEARSIIPGVPPPALRVMPYVVNLAHANIPLHIISALSKGSTLQMVDYLRRSILPPVFDSSTYGLHFKTLLWAEEFRMGHDLEMYDIHDAKLTNHAQYYYLMVPGLAENRPSVLVGDTILVQRSGSQNGEWFEGHVHVVRKEEVGLCFHASFRTAFNPDRVYSVRFKLNRFPLRRQHQALDTVFHPDRILFPLLDHVDEGPFVALKYVLRNRLVATNPAQLQAVTSIVRQKPGAAPFVVFGPPGTGKTITIVEAIFQILQHNPNARILACAPSNSAADLIALRLLTLGNNKLFRFYAPARSKSHVPDKLLAHCCITPNGHFSVPPMHILKQYKVVVSTCVSASFAYGIGVPRGHFTHIFLDEAGQATEPEMMIAIKTIADNSTNIVLSGDPKQLGPIIRSPVTRKLGLETSYLERLMGREAYDEVEGYGKTVVKLVQNYRSHPDILSFPNARFYKGELQPRGDPSTINAYINSPLLVNPEFPIIFHAVTGKDDREASSPSFFNIDEATQVRYYVEELRANRRVRIKASVADADIGVIAPYHAQCLKIRRILNVTDDLKVGSVEEFQGQERKVIIVSTVRSNKDFVEYDLKHTLGFVANPRRFNGEIPVNCAFQLTDLNLVTVTRAKALLIVVGNPLVLALDPLWRSFLNYIYDNGGWKGEAPTWDTEEEDFDHAQNVREMGLNGMNEFTRRMESMTLDHTTNLEENDEDPDANVDRPWRELE